MHINLSSRFVHGNTTQLECIKQGILPTHIIAPFGYNDETHGCRIVTRGVQFKPRSDKCDWRILTELHGKLLIGRDIDTNVETAVMGSWNFRKNNKNELCLITTETTALDNLKWYFRGVWDKARIPINGLEEML